MRRLQRLRLRVKAIQGIMRRAKIARAVRLMPKARIRKALIRNALR